jgi:quercetin dioxygenase-like cupin family protein
MHVTTLNPGQVSHAPHQHENEELIILKQGTLETLSLGKWQKVEAGSIIFNASNDLHGVKNIGTVPAVYHVVNWKRKP